MKPFQIQSTNNAIGINNANYNIIEVDVSTLGNKQALQPGTKTPIKNTKGVYIFISEKDFPKFNINYFNSEVTGIFFKQNRPYVKEVGVPPFIETPQEDCIFYVGRADKVISRIKEHWNNDKINGCKSLKLGFTSRKWIKKFLKVYVITSCVDGGKKLDNKQLEKDIRAEWGSAFGE